MYKDRNLSFKVSASAFYDLAEGDRYRRSTEVNQSVNDAFRDVAAEFRQLEGSGVKRTNPIPSNIVFSK